jgi:hypothetical protein
MRCFEINLLLIDHDAKKTKEMRQYFHQDKGVFQAILDTIAWVHYKIKAMREPNYVVEKLMVYEWRIDSPSMNGHIGSTKFPDRVFNWSFEKGIIEADKLLSDKQRRKINEPARSLNMHRKKRSEVKIVEIGQEIEDGLIAVNLT